MSESIRLLVADEVPESPARVDAPTRPPFRIGAVQHRWHPDPVEHRAALAEGVRMAAGEGAELVCLQELTLSPYFAITADGPAAVGAEPEDLPGGPTFEFAAGLAAETGVAVHASLYERPSPEEKGPSGPPEREAGPSGPPEREAGPSGPSERDAGVDGLGFNTAIVVTPDGELVARTRKLHIPVTAGYHEDRYFRKGDGGYPVVALGDARFGFPTCWDQWFPELARAYSLAGADVIVYPTAIGSEPDHPGFDTQPLWQQVIVGNGIANGTFMVAVNRIGTEGPSGPATESPGAGSGPPLTFYGSSFISDPYGRVLVQAPRDEPAVLVADLDLDQRRDWLDLFPFLTTRRPDTYDALVDDG